MTTLREIYRVDQLPVFQNKMFRSATEAIACTRGDLILVQDLMTGLIYRRREPRNRLRPQGCIRRKRKPARTPVSRSTISVWTPAST